jgi:hypothetical protein
MQLALAIKKSQSEKNMNQDNYYIPHLEWESIPFPLAITRFTTNESLFGFADDSILTIERTDNFKLTGKITGTVLYPSELGKENYIGKGNIIEGRNLNGEDPDGNMIELASCHLVFYHPGSWNKAINGPFIEGTLVADKFTITYKKEEKSENYKRIRRK